MRDEGPQLKRTMQAAAAEARRVWPELTSPGEVFLSRLRERADAAENAEEALQSLCVADLHLAVLCAQGDGAAVAAFEREIMPKVRTAIMRVDSTPAFVDEVTQAVREKLFVANVAGERKIEQYSGEGPLANWARVVAVRTAINLRQSRGFDMEEKSATLAEAALHDGDPELGYLREQLRGTFKQAFGDALATLAPHERNLVRLHYGEGLSLERIGVMQGANKSTISRRLERIRSQLVDETRRSLRERFGIHPGELESAMRLFTSRFSLSVTGLLAGTASDQEPQ